MGRTPRTPTFVPRVGLSLPVAPPGPFQVGSSESIGNVLHA
jgi:hypothetical protein